MSDRMRGFVFFNGPSLIIPNVEIVGISTLFSENTKTGPMIQTWILAANLHPIEAVKSGLDRAICGDCKLRFPMKPTEPRFKESIRWRFRLCYVTVSRVGAAVFRAFRDGSYPDLSLDPDRIMKLSLGRVIRIGSYGEPTAIPIEAWNPILSSVLGYTGYTQRWLWKENQAWRPYLRASCHSDKQVEMANKMGWQTFRTLYPNQSPLDSEKLCPASKEAGKVMTCFQCMACGGSDGKSREPIYIPLH